MFPNAYLGFHFYLTCLMCEIMSSVQGQMCRRKETLCYRIANQRAKQRICSRRGYTKTVIAAVYGESTSVTGQKWPLLQRSGYWPSQCDRRALEQIKSLDSTQNAGRWKTPSPPDSRLLPLCHFITSDLPWNKLECSKCGESQAASFVTLSDVLWLAISLSMNASIISCVCIYRLIPVWFTAPVW